MANDVAEARYFGRTKTLFQVCLAAAVANLTLLAAASDILSMRDSTALGWLPVILAIMPTLSGLLLGIAIATLITRHSTHLHQLIQPMAPSIRSLTPPSRPRS